MTTQAQQSTSSRAFVDARFVQTRMVSESVSSLAGKPSTEPQQIQLNTNVTSNVSVGLDNPLDPKDLFVEIEYNALLKLPDGEKTLLTYTAKHVSHFKLVGWTGFNDWAAIPQGALGPYFAIASVLAQRRAERTLLDMGLRGIALPRVNAFDEYSNALAEGVRDERAAVG